MARLGRAARRDAAGRSCRHGPTGTDLPPCVAPEPCSCHGRTASSVAPFTALSAGAHRTVVAAGYLSRALC